MSKASGRSNAADKFYWTRIFRPTDPIHYMLEPDELKPGVYCINDDLEKNKELILDKDSDQDRLAEPFFEPKAWAEFYGKVIEVKNFEIEQEELQTYGEMATTIRKEIAARAMEQELEFQRRHPEYELTEKRLDTLVQKRNPEDGSKREGPYKALGTDDFGLKRKRKMFTMSELSPNCMMDIRHSVLVLHLTYKDAAAKHMVKP
jgi:hypothetical protein